MIMMMMTG